MVRPEDYGAVPVQQQIDPAAYGAVPMAAKDSGAPRTANGLWDDLVAGHQSSATMLLGRGKLPDVVLDPRHSKWYDELLSNVASTATDIPLMGISAGIPRAIGSAFGPVGRAAGAAIGNMAAFAVPTEIRESLMKAYRNGDAKDAATFLGRTNIILNGLSDKEVQAATAKSAAAGLAVTMGGGLSAMGLGSQFLRPAIGESTAAATARTTGELGTLAIAPAALDGKLPSAMDIANAGILVAGLHAAKALSGYAADKVSNIYAKTGIEPEQVASDAQKDPSLKAEILSGNDATEIPAAYKQAESSENARSVVREPDAPPSQRASAFAGDMYGEHPQTPGGKKVTGYPNINMFNVDKLENINSVDDLAALSASAAEKYSDVILKQTGGAQSIDQIIRQASEMLSDLTGANADMLAARVPGTGTGAVEMYIRGQAALAFMDHAKGLADSWDPEKSSPEDTVKMLAAAERAAMAQAYYEGAGSEAGRAMRIRQQMRAGINSELRAQLDEAIKEGDPEKIATAIKTMNDPAQVAAFTRNAFKPKALSTNQKALSLYKTGLLSGTKIYQVKAIGDAIQLASGVVDKMVASVVGLVTGSADRVQMSDVGGYITGMKMGMKNTLEVFGANWTKYGTQASAANPHGYKAIFGEQAKAGEPTQPPEAGSISDIANKVVNIPGRIIGAETDVAKMYNEEATRYYLAERQARAEGLNKGNDQFSSRVQELVSNSRDDAIDRHAAESDQINALKASGDKSTAHDERLSEIQKYTDIHAESVQAGKEGTFTNKGGSLWKALNYLHKLPAGGYIIPFDTVPSNLTKWAVSRIPLVANMLDTVRADFEAGGARRDIAIARQAIGGAIMASAYAAVKSGVLTGGGLFMNPQQKEAQKDTRQNYSITMNGKAYSIARFEPASRLIELTADICEMSDHLNEDDRASMPVMMAMLFGNATLSQTYLAGLNNLVKAIDDPNRSGPQYFDTLVGSAVPSLLAQVAKAHDPYERRVDKWTDAIQARIPMFREELLPKINALTGEPLNNSSDLTPVDTKTLSTDKVLTEAKRLDIGVAKAPKSIQLQSPLDKKLGRVDITPEQQNVYSITSGSLAHKILDKLVESDTWKTLPDIKKVKIFSDVMKSTREQGSYNALPGPERAIYARQIADKVYAKVMEAPAQ